jgi:hypothetical protein
VLHCRRVVAHRAAQAAHKLQEPPVSRRFFLAEASFDLGSSPSLALPNGSRPSVKLFVRRATLPMLTGAVLCTVAMPAPTALHQAFAVLLEAADASVLRQVLGLLLERAEPVRQAAVLRAAIVDLLDAPAGPRPAAVKRQASPNRPAARSLTHTRWAELRPRLRAQLAGGVPEQEIAAALGIATTTLHRLMTRARRGASAAVIARATAWLAAHETDVSPGTTENASADRLSTEQRERLAFLAQHDQSEIRREAHVTRAQLEQAVAGEALDPAVVLRLSDLLSGRPSSSFPGYPT